MVSPSELSRDSEMSAYTRRQRLFGGWWRRQSPTRQDRFATIGPLVSVLLFLAAIIAAFWYLRNEEIARETGWRASCRAASPTACSSTHWRRPSPATGRP